MYYIGILLWAACASVTCGAETALSSATPATDLSMHYLAQIFGVMDGLLHGTGSQILGNLSKAFNSILLIVLGVVWAYTAFIGILNTASDGQFLGQQGGSIWLPLRMVVGMCALVPKATTGYSIIQILVMYLVIQGINFANFINNTALQYLERGGTVVEMSHTFMDEDFKSQEQYQNLLRTIGDVLKSEVRMLMLYKTMLAQKKTSNWEAVPNFSYMLRPYEKTVDTSYMRFPHIAQAYYGKWQHLEGVCGELTWGNTPLMNANVQLMVLNLLPLAEQIVNEAMLQPQETAKEEFPKQVPTVVRPQENIQVVPEISIRMTKKQPEQDTVQASGINYNVPPQEKNHLPQGQLVNITNDFIALAKSEWRHQAIQKDTAIKQELNTLGARIQQGGWITAGSHYYQLAQYNQKINNVNQGFNVYNNRLNVRDVSNQALKNQLKDVSQYEQLQNCLQKIDYYIDEEIGYAEQLAASTTSHKNNAPLYHKNSLLKPLTKNIQLLQEHLDATLKSQIDPISSLSSMGHDLMRNVESVWEDLIKENSDFWKELLTGNGLESERVSVFTPLILIWMTFNFTIGATLTYYIPLLPFLFYFFGSLTWLIQVMEIVFIGGPLACVGLAHPQGQSFAGKAGQAIMLITHVMLRPVLMVLGLIAGMILSTIAFSLFNHGYLIAIKMIDQLNGELLGIISHTAMMTIYTTISYSIVSRTFAMINDLPNKALRSMEGLTDGNNEAEPAMQVKSSIDQYAGNVSNPILRPQK